MAPILWRVERGKLFSGSEFPSSIRWFKAKWERARLTSWKCHLKHLLSLWWWRWRGGGCYPRYSNPREGVLEEREEGFSGEGSGWAGALRRHAEDHGEAGQAGGLAPEWPCEGQRGRRPSGPGAVLFAEGFCMSFESLKAAVQVVSVIASERRVKIQI